MGRKNVAVLVGIKILKLKPRCIQLKVLKVFRTSKKILDEMVIQQSSAWGHGGRVKKVTLR